MTAQLLTSELSTLIQESKRKNPDLRAVRFVFTGVTTMVVDVVYRLPKSH